MKVLHTVAAACVSVVVTTAAWAEDIALVLSNTGHEYLPGIHQSLNARGLAIALRGAGFQVTEGRDLDIRGLRQFATGFQAQMREDPDRVIIVLTGHFASADGQVRLLGTRARQPGRFSVDAQGLSVNAIAETLTAVQGRALLVLASPQEGFATGEGVFSGISGLIAPQGVTLIEGPVNAMRDLVEHGFLEQGRPFSEVAAEAYENVRISGFLPDALSFTPVEPDPLQQPAYVAELAYWEAARDIGTAAAVNAYLNRYPNGQFVQDARAMKNQFVNDAQNQMQQVEQALNLSRDNRMTLQRSLSLLGFSPRGIDGVFGQGTRAAISSWQQNNGFSVTGYFNRRQVNLLRQQAETRAAELEEEARQRQQAMERQDRAFWRETGKGSSEDGLRAYLRRYPDGVFADKARDRMHQIQEERRRTTAKAERRAWDQAAEADTMQGYQAFLNSYPESRFAGAAQDRMAELRDRNANRDLLDQALAQERALTGNQITRVLVERRLAQMGVLPQSQVDGVFNDLTRRAIRRFQRSRDIMPTGYVTQLTLVQLLASLGGEDPEH